MGLDIMGKSWSGDLHGRKTAGSLLVERKNDRKPSSF
jgi:hypothetical protein